MARPKTGSSNTADRVSRSESHGPPVEGYTWPEFATEVLRLLRRIAALEGRRFVPLDVLLRWLASDWGPAERSRLVQWRDAQRIRRILAELRVDLGLDSPDSRSQTPRNHYNVNNSKPGSKIKVTMGNPSPGEARDPDKEGGHEDRPASRQGKERKQDRGQGAGVVSVGPGSSPAWSRG